MNRRRRCLFWFLHALIIGGVGLAAVSLWPLCRVRLACHTIEMTILAEGHKDKRFRDCGYCNSMYASEIVPIFDQAMDTLFAHDAEEAAVPLLGMALVSENSELRHGAARYLARIGPRAKQAVPVLVITLRDQDRHVFDSAMTAMEHIGAAALPPLITALGDTESRERVCGAGGRLGPIAQPANPHLPSVLDHGTFPEQWAAAEALGSIGLAAAPELARRLGTPVTGNARLDDVTAVAEVGLRRMGEPAIPYLIDALRLGAGADALCDIGRAAIPTLVEARKSDDVRLREEAMKVLQRLYETYPDERGSLPPEAPP